MKNLKNPSISLKLLGESGMLSPRFGSTVPPYIIGSGVLPNSTSLKTPSEGQWAFSPVEHSKLHVFTEKLDKNRPVADALAQASTSDLSSESRPSSGGAEDYYSGSEEGPSDEDLSIEQTQHQHQPQFNLPVGNTDSGLWTLRPAGSDSRTYNFQAEPSLESSSKGSPYSSSGNDDTYEDDSKSVEQPQPAFSHSSRVAYIPTTPGGPSPVPAASRRVDDGTQDLNRINDDDDKDYGSLSLDELENLAVIDEDQISKYFIKTHPKEILTRLPPPVPLNYVIKQDDRSMWVQRNYSQVDLKPEPSFSTSLKNKYVPQTYHAEGPSTRSPKYEQPETRIQIQVTTTVEPVLGQGSVGLKAPLMQSNSRDQIPLPEVQTHVSVPSHAGQQQQSSQSQHFPISSQNYLPPPQEKYTPTYDYQSTVSPTVFPTYSSVETMPTATTTDATSIPGMPGIDYPILSEIPYTGFDCQKQRYKGFFADIDTKCQAWHYCDFTDGHSTFLCPNGTLFSQVLLTCDWWFNVDCTQAQQLYVLNERLYRYIKPPKPSFPEDFHGPQVDLWLAQQLQLGNLPKMKKKIKDKVVINGNN